MHPHTLSAERLQKLADLRWRVADEPANLSLKLELAWEIFWAGHWYIGLRFLDELEKEEVNDQAQQLRFGFMKGILQLFDPTNMPGNIKPLGQEVYNALENLLPDGLYSDEDKAFILFQLFDRQGFDELAVYFCQRSAEHGHPAAMAHLGICYYQGRVVAKIDELAFHWTLCAALLHNPKGLNNLGSMYLDGTGTKVDYALAYKYMKMGYDLGKKISLGDLGMLCYEGKGVKQDHTQARAFWQEGAQCGYQDCARYLTQFFPHDKGGH